MEKERDRKILPKIIGSVVVLAVIVSGFFWLSDQMNPFNDQKFDQKVWLAQQNSSDPKNPRGPMAEDVCKHIVRTGMTRHDVKSLLGSPDAGGHAGSDAPASPKDGSKYSYTLGHWKCPFCDNTLDVAFDGGGKVTAIEIVGH